VRASVDDLDKAEEVGFLSGNDEKMQVYLHPLEDTLDFIARNRLKDSKDTGDSFEAKIQETKEKIRSRCNIEAIIGLGMRGRTFHDTIFIIDEAANQSKASLQKMLTRIGKNCKVVLIGSQRQIDNSFLNKYTNGLSVVLDACSKPHEKVRLHAVSLPKVVRGNVAEFSEKLFSKEQI
jgi:PhoH-like ATPase